MGQLCQWRNLKNQIEKSFEAIRFKNNPGSEGCGNENMIYQGGGHVMIVCYSEVGTSLDSIWLRKNRAQIEFDPPLFRIGT